MSPTVVGRADRDRRRAGLRRDRRAGLGPGHGGRDRRVRRRTRARGVVIAGLHDVGARDGRRRIVNCAWPLASVFTTALATGVRPGADAERHLRCSAAGVPRSRIVAVKVCAGPPTTDVALLGTSVIVSWQKSGISSFSSSEKKSRTAGRDRSEEVDDAGPEVAADVGEEGVEAAVAGRVVRVEVVASRSGSCRCSAARLATRAVRVLADRRRCRTRRSAGSWTTTSSWLTGTLELLTTPIKVSSTPS